MPDIRSFFAPKGGAPSKPAPAKSEDASKTQRAKNRKVVQDSDEDEDADLQPRGVVTTADAYFASSGTGTKSTQVTPSTPKKTPQTGSSKVKAEEERVVRSSPRNRKPAVKADSPSQNGSSATKKKPTTAHHPPVVDDDEDAYVDDAAEDADDIFAADNKGRSKRKNDDYEEEESDEEVFPKAKRVATRGRASQKAAGDGPASSATTTTTTTTTFSPPPRSRASTLGQGPSDHSQHYFLSAFEPLFALRLNRFCQIHISSARICLQVVISSSATRGTTLSGAAASIAAAAVPSLA
ncbi:hypothetical protein E4U40_004845 [Claviceps sp. LM458 group G5]|nr:hypothetical protein E4U40_004845 [Claviceps sp. LM458 group G5]